jgi:hypothetical protein
LSKPVTGIAAQPLSLLPAAAQWFLASGIQEPSGGVARYYYSVRQENARISSEITGYAISSLLELQARLGGDELIDAAVAAGRFLCRDAWDKLLAAMPFEWPPQGPGLSYFFDNGIIARALLRLNAATGEREFLTTALACGVSMLRDFSSNGGIHPILVLPEKTPLRREPRWSRAGGCYQLKSALAWLELHLETGREDFLNAYESALALALADAPAFLTAEGENERLVDRLHAYCYFLEGLLPVVDRDECRDAFCAGVALTADWLRRLRPVFERSDVCAQLLRVRLYGDALGVLPLDAAAAREEAGWAARFQCASRDERVHGGFCFGEREGRRFEHINPVSTAFAMQALAMWHERAGGGECPDWHDLI